MGKVTGMDLNRPMASMGPLAGPDPSMLVAGRSP